MRTERKVRILEKLASFDTRRIAQRSPAGKTLGRALTNPKTGSPLPRREQSRLKDSALTKIHYPSDKVLDFAGKTLGRKVGNPRTGGKLPGKEARRLADVASTKRPPPFGTGARLRSRKTEREAQTKSQIWAQRRRGLTRVPDEN